MTVGSTELCVFVMIMDFMMNFKYNMTVWTWITSLPPPHPPGADYSNAYIDAKDAQWLCSGDLSPADINGISASQFVIYRFGVFIIRLLHQNIGTPEVSMFFAIEIAKWLPMICYVGLVFYWTRTKIKIKKWKYILFVMHTSLNNYTGQKAYISLKRKNILNVAFSSILDDFLH